MTLGRYAAPILSCLALFASPGIAFAADTTCDEKTALGVERVVEIDTKDGPRRGHVQYKDIDFLEPGEVVLTFDDGPLAQTTPAVLEALAAHCTKAIFFMVGRMAVANPEMVRKVDALGHTVGYHTWSHKNLARQSASNAEREVELGLSAVTAALGKPIAPFFRYPYLSDSRTTTRHFEERNQGNFSIDVDSYDWRTRSRSAMHNNVLSQLDKSGKGIILFHDIQRVTASSLKELLDELKRRKYKVVHLVPKATAATVASYDEMAGKLLAKSQVTAAQKPMTTRSMVWPATAGSSPDATVTRPDTPAKGAVVDPQGAQETRPAASSKRATQPNSNSGNNSSRAAAARPAPPRQEPNLLELMFGPVN